MLSRSCQFVNYDCALDMGTNEAPITITGKKLIEGAYYISVIGIEPSYYTIAVEVRILDETHIV